MFEEPRHFEEQHRKVSRQTDFVSTKFKYCACTVRVKGKDYVNAKEVKYSVATFSQNASVVSIA